MCLWGRLAGGLATQPRYAGLFLAVGVARALELAASPVVTVQRGISAGSLAQRPYSPQKMLIA